MVSRLADVQFPLRECVNGRCNGLTRSQTHIRVWDVEIEESRRIAGFHLRHDSLFAAIRKDQLEFAFVGSSVISGC